MKFHRIVPALIVLLLSSCSSSPFPELNWDQWQEDKFGCLGIRTEMAKEIRAAKEEIKGKEMKEILTHLGKPDEKELFKRSKTYFRYFIQHQSCDSSVKENKFVQLRFNATERVDEIIVLE